MIILAMDMSGDRCTIGVGEKERVLAESSVYARMRHLPRVMPQIEYTLSQAGKRVQDIDLLCAVSGPGSWTGIRIAITMIKTFAHVLSIPCVTVGALDALACNLQCDERNVYAIIDAARKQVYCAGYSNHTGRPQPIDPPTLKNLDLFLSQIISPAILVGDAIYVYPEIVQYIQGKPIKTASNLFNQVQISHVIAMAYREFQQKGSADIYALAPIYLQQTDAERNFKPKQ